MKAAAKGGVTTMLEMPGTQMGCFDIEQHREKKAIMEKAAYVDFCVDILKLQKPC
jgi:dihydroorotase-like cyclic amidohydrolase